MRIYLLRFSYFSVFGQCYPFGVSCKSSYLHVKIGSYEDVATICFVVRFILFEMFDMTRQH